MDRLLTEDQRRILASVDGFAAQHLPPDEVRRRDREHQTPYDLLPAMGEAGFFALAVPEAHGGLGLGWREVALVQERLGRHGYMAASIYNRVVGFGVMSVLAYGSEAQKGDLLPGLLSGAFFIALALTEPGAGSDAGALCMRARRTAGGYVISGAKIWISDAKGARFLLTAARTGEAATGSDGVTLFLVPSDAPGLTLSPLAKVGNNCMPSFEIGFTDVEVGEEAVIGEVGGGFRHLMSTLHYSRASMAATVTGAAQAALDGVMAHARERQQFGKPIGSFQVLAHRLADLQTRVDLSRLMVRHLATLIDSGLPCKREAAQAKVVATETLRDVADQGMQIMASAGYAADSDIQRFWRDSRLYTFGEGTNEILRDGMARELGLTGRQPT
ncbi:acyl-CoA dehydrogenase family protein [Phreatobacter sp.]|uniref:acyl-CoA dehydrogenase family protein n=1 Tax=Phreatobacter sp. TaxID=1966341 RepID=UPI0022C5E77F|nr:acyl-CoA dehydrogenase family protein [Phreatobacter sp.]MCZ8313705.1 acyl-CoA/acyl-ACP dehydrogenase [Phreatobacter sp.]